MTEYKTHHFQASSDYTVSVHYDRRLYSHDIRASKAHARMMGKQGIISAADAEMIINGLESVRLEIENGAFPWRMELEDLHMNIETRLFELVGDVAGRLHTARSRNDQVATATRLFTLESISEINSRIDKFQRCIVAVSESSPEVIMPGYTHLQRAQPVLFAHHMLAYFEMFDRDYERFQECAHRANVLPLGSGAFAGVPYPIDREYVAKELGFETVSENSMDAVSDRDYLVEFIGDAAICMMHSSRMAEELVTWSSQEFGFVQLDSRWVTGSSIMPQKRNPDFAELARGKTGRVYGNLIGLLTVLKGLPMSYNRDLQEDKEFLFDTVDTLIGTLDAFQGMLSTAHIRTANMELAASDHTLIATDIADYLVAKGAPFREAHSIVSKLCQRSQEINVPLQDLKIKEYLTYSPLFATDVYEITARSSIQARNVRGGTSPGRVQEALARAREKLEGRTSR
jgi:argininosuccinate lyase